MTDLEPVDRVEVHVLIDNVTDSHSTIHNHAEAEFSFLERHGMTELSGDRICCACHGFSCLITAYRGALRHTVLFDSGPEEYAFERNSKRLGVDLGNGQPEELDGLDGRRQPSLGGTSRMSREAQVRICEGLGAKFPGPTRRTETGLLLK